MAVDLADAYEVRTELMGAADSAALGAISEKSPGFLQVKQMTTDGEVEIANQDGKELFLAQRAGLGNVLKDLPIDVSIKVVKKGGDISSTVTFSASVPTTFMRVLGTDSVGISGTATAVYGGKGKTYTNFYMLLDNTPSMGIAATRQGMKDLIGYTAGGAAGDGNCAFACHILWTGANGDIHEDPNSTYMIARKKGVTLRIDVVAKAAKALVEDVKKDIADSANFYHIAAYTFGKAALEPGYRIERVASSTDMTTVGTALGNVELMTTDHHGFNQDALTSFQTALSDLNHEIKKDGGDGSSSSNRRKVVFFVTDGMGDSLHDGSCDPGGRIWDNNRCVEPIDVTYCAALKKRNIDIAVLYTTYLPLDGDHIWETAIKNVFADKIGTKLKECASDDLFLEVRPEDDMEAAMSILFFKAASGEKSLRLAN